jgi:hypothetical protein
MYYWTYGQTEEGRKVLSGPYRSKSEANLEADKLDDVEIFFLKTRNTQKATRIVKAKLSKKTRIDTALEPMSHKTKVPTAGGALAGGDNLFEGGDSNIGVGE